MTGTADRVSPLFVGITGREPEEPVLRLLETVRPAGLVLFARNIESATQVRRLLGEIRRRLDYQPIVAIDQEHGRVNRLRSIVGELPGIAALKAAGPRAVSQFGGQTARQLQELGMHLDLAPVFDLELFDQTVDNALRERCWGRTGGEVATWTAAFLEGLQTAGVAGCPKHFPGLGGGRQDSHDRLPVIRRSRAQLQEDLEPYVRTAADLTALMVGHGAYPALDRRRDQPASLSPAILTDLLRNELHFDGLVLTDDLEMGAITSERSFPSAVLAALEAGADCALVCHTPEKILEAHRALTEAAHRGALSEERFDASRRRIHRFRQRWRV